MAGTFFAPGVIHDPETLVQSRNPRENLREGRPLDASEFAVHLDQVRDSRAPSVYQNPDEFFERTYLTKSLKGLAGEVVRRLNGIKVETNAVFNLTGKKGWHRNFAG